MHGITLHPNITGGPWGGRPDGDSGKRRPERPRGGGNDLPPEIDAVIRDAQDRFRKSFGGRPGPGHTTGGLGILALVLVAIWLGTGFYRVQPSEHAVILTFGRMTETRTQPGLGWRIPWPVQQVQTVDIALDRRITVGFQGDVPAPRNVTNTNIVDVPSESLMVTGDENIIDIDFVVLWRVSDAANYLFSIRDPDTTIKKVAESAMREIIGRTQIQKALTEGRGDIEVRTKELMQQILDEYQAGVTVNAVQLQKVDPPATVVDAFDDVQRSRADKERLRNEAETYANDIVPRARGEAQKTLQDAEAYKQSVIAKAEGDAHRFLSVYESYRQAKDVTQKRMYLETMQQILRRSDRVIVGDGGAPVMPYLSLDKVQKGGAQ